MNKVSQQRRASRTRYQLKINNSDNRCRLSVHLSNQHIHVQIIDDQVGKTLVSASTLEKVFRELKVSSRNKNAATIIGSCIAERAKHAGIDQLVFDRGMRRYIAGNKLDIIASAIREGGIAI